MLAVRREKTAFVVPNAISVRTVHKRVSVPYLLGCHPRRNLKGLNRRNQSRQKCIACILLFRVSAARLISRKHIINIDILSKLFPAFYYTFDARPLHGSKIMWLSSLPRSLGFSFLGFSLGVTSKLYEVHKL